jgi:hypothetical protein
MIEQTELIVSKWQFTPYEGIIEAGISNFTTLDVKKKRAPTKKGIACRFSCQFIFENQVILDYVGEDSYVIDFSDVIDITELRTMIRNSFSKFNETFDIRKLGTVLQNTSIMPLDETQMDLEPVLLLLI